MSLKRHYILWIGAGPAVARIPALRQKVRTEAASPAALAGRAAVQSDALAQLAESDSMSSSQASRPGDGVMTVVGSSSIG